MWTSCLTNSIKHKFFLSILSFSFFFFSSKFCLILGSFFSFFLHTYFSIFLSSYLLICNIISILFEASDSSLLRVVIVTELYTVNSIYCMLEDHGFQSALTILILALPYCNHVTLGTEWSHADRYLTTETAHWADPWCTIA